MARVETHAQRQPRPQPPEEVDGFRRILEPAQRLRFQREAQRPIRAFAHARNVLAAGAQAAAHRGRLLFLRRRIGVGKTLERSGHRAHAARHARRQPFHQQIEQAAGVFQPGIGRPVRRVDLFLDASAVEPAEREAVDREHVAFVRVEPAAKRLARGPVGGKLARGEIAQAQADGEGLARRTHERPDRQHVGLQRGKGFRPVVAAQDVRAIGEVAAVGQVHASWAVMCGFVRSEMIP